MNVLLLVISLVLAVVTSVGAVVKEPVDHVRERLRVKDYATLTQKQRVCIDLMYTRPSIRILAGGSGFGGKSHVYRAAAVHYCQRAGRNGWGVPSVVCATNTYPALRDRHVPNFLKEWGLFGSYHGNHSEFGNCFIWHDKRMPAICWRNLDTVGKKGSGFGAGFLDELTENDRPTYAEFEYMCRNPEVPFNPILAPTNPDGIGFTWVKELFKPHLREPYPEGELSDAEIVERLLADPMCFAGYSELFDPMQVIQSRDHVYVQFYPWDNPTYTEERFLATIQNQPYHVQVARRYGRWDVAEGSRWPWLDPERTLFRMERRFPRGVPYDTFHMVSVDWGSAAPYAPIWTFREKGTGDYFSWKMKYRAGLTPMQQITEIRDETPEGLVVERFVGDPQMWEVRNDVETGRPGRAIQEIYNEETNGDARFPHGFAQGSRGEVRHKLATLDSLLEYDNGRPNWFIEANACSALWGELNSAVYGKDPFGNRTEDVDKRCALHAVSSSYFGFHGWLADVGKEAGPQSAEDLIAQRLSARLERMREQAMREVGGGC